jgi:glutaredoxin-like protein
LGLAEFAKFFPEVQDELVPVTRELFLTPVVAAAVLFGLRAHGGARCPITRLVVTGFSILLVLAALPPYQFLRAPEYRNQLMLTAVGLLLVLLTAWAARLPRRAQGILVALLAVAGASAGLWQFAHLHPLVVALYNQPVGLGWGVVACAAGFALLLLSGILAAVAPDRPIPDTRHASPATDPVEAGCTAEEEENHRMDRGKEGIIFYGTTWCPDCRRAQEFLDQRGVPYRWIDIDEDAQARAYVEAVNRGYRSVPTIVFPDGSTLVEPSNTELARKLGEVIG